MSAPIPIIHCGKLPVVVEAAKAAYLPETEMIYALHDSDAAAVEIPSILKGEILPAGPSANIGTQNFSKLPQAIIVGGGFTNDDFEKIRTACKGLISVPWLRADMTKPAPPLGPEYGVAMVQRIKVCIEELVAEGKMSADAIYLF